MNLKTAVLDESFKLEYGINKNYTEQWDTNHIGLCCAKNDWAAFILLILTDEDCVLSLDGSPAFCVNGSADAIRLEAVAPRNMNIKMQAIELACDDDGVMKADLLLDTKTIQLQRQKPQAVWVEIGVGNDVLKGNCKGEIKLYTHTLFSAEQFERSFTFDIEVFDVLMPSEKDFYLDLWQHNSNIARKHEVDLWSDRHFKIMEGYVKSLGELGQKAVTVIASEIPWSGQRGFETVNYLSDLYEYSMIGVAKRNGQFHYDYTVMQRYIDLCASYGIDTEIEVFGLINIWTSEEMGFGAVACDYPDAIRIRYYDEDAGIYRYMVQGSQIKEYIAALGCYFQSKGLLDKVRIVADEPADIERYRKSLQAIKEAFPTFQYKTAINHVEFVAEFENEIKDIVPMLPAVATEWERIEEFREKSGNRVLWYVCCMPDFPNTFICSPLCESRLIPILSFFMPVDGFLRWNYTVWPENPRQRISYRAPFWKAGDTNFVYPSYNGAPLLSLRYKLLKRGVEDYQLMSMVAQRLGTDCETIRSVKQLLLRKELRSYLPDAKPEEFYSLNYADYELAKRILLEALEG